MARVRPGEKHLPPARPNVGLRARYRRALERLVRAMATDFHRTIAAAYEEHEPILARDATPARELEAQLRRLGEDWRSRFDKIAPEMARWFAGAAQRRTSAAYRRILKDGGLTVQFKMTRAMRDVVDATVAENVALIRSIPEAYHAQVQGIVMRSVTAGRDLGGLARALQQQHGVTERRAALIARDQNNKATAVFTRVRQEEAGIEEAVWLHSHGGKVPRPTHLANDGKRYKVAEGWFDPDPKVRRRIWPGELINCRCVPRAVIKGFS